MRYKGKGEHSVNSLEELAEINKKENERLKREIEALKNEYNEILAPIYSSKLDMLEAKIKVYKHAIDYWNNEENWIYGEPNKDGSRNTYSIRHMVNRMKELTKETK